MKIILIQPKMNMRPMDTKLKTQMSPPLSLLTLIKLTPNHHNVKLVNENIEQIDFNEQADLIGITVTVDVLNRAADIAKRFRGKGVPVVAGGIHITAAPDESLKYFNAICVGMAERVWVQILKDAEARCLKSIYKDMDNITGAEICPPAYDAIDKSKYLYTNIISTSRGCPHKCDFCYNSCDNSVNYINRPIEHVISDIKTLKTKHIMFIDDNFIGNPAWTREFLTAVKPMGLTFNCAATTSILKHLDLLDLMKETGCKSIFIGFETINRRSLESVHKKQNNIDLYNKLIEEIHKRGIMINASIVFGLPNDSPEIFKSTLNWLVKNKIETVTAHILTPYPGTSVYKKMLSENKITDFDLSHYNTAHVVYKPESMSKEQLYNGYVDFYRQFYKTQNILKRIPQNKYQLLPFLMFNYVYRKYGKFTELLSKVIPLYYIGRAAAILSYFINDASKKTPVPFRQPALPRSF